MLEGFYRQADSDFDLVVVSDGGDANAEMTVMNEYLGDRPRWRYVYLPDKTVPFRAAAARNKGMQFAKGERVLFMDSDTVPSIGVVGCHKQIGPKPVIVLGYVRRIAEADVLAAGIPDVQRGFRGIPNREDRRMELRGVYRLLQQPWQAGQVTYEASTPLGYRFCWSYHMSVPLELTRSIGGFWEAFTEHSGEDQELALRLVKSGCKILMDFRITSWHLDHPLRGNPNSDKHHQMIADSCKQPTLIRNGGPLQPIN